VDAFLRSLVCLLVVSCGRINFAADQDGADATIAACSPWQGITHHPALATARIDWGPALHLDGLVIVFARRDIGSSIPIAAHSPGVKQLWICWGGYMPRNPTRSHQRQQLHPDLRLP
jgi:hypothetical protein